MKRITISWGNPFLGNSPGLTTNLSYVKVLYKYMYVQNQTEY